jgi:hypothetical protein
MAARQRKAGSSGRITPKGGPNKPSDASPPKRHSPIDPEKPVVIGRRPSGPGFLALVAVMWIAVGIILFLTLKSGWRLVPSIVAVGIGLMFLRGAMATVVRRDRRSREG